MPDLIIFPRSGNHMVREVFLSLTGNIIRIEHDVLAKDRYEKRACVVRNPIDVVYSYHFAVYGTNWNTEWITNMFIRLKSHREWYDKASSIIVSYEQLVEEINSGVPIKWIELGNFMGVQASVKEWTKALSENSKEKTIKKIISRCSQESDWINENMLTQKYTEGRVEFKSRYSFLVEGLIT